MPQVMIDSDELQEMREDLEYYEKREGKQSEEIRRLQDVLKGTDNQRLISDNYRLRNDKVRLEMELATANHLKDKYRRQGALERIRSLEDNSAQYSRWFLDEANKNNALVAENTKAKKRIDVLEAELNAAHETVLGSLGSNAMLIQETVMAYNRELVIGECEMSVDEMRDHMTDKVTIPITREA